MGKTYKIKCKFPKDYNPWPVLERLPSEHITRTRQIYNYSVEKDGFYLTDNLINPAVAGHAMKLLVDEALQLSSEVIIQELEQ